MRSLRCSGVWPSLARSTRWLVAAALRGRVSSVRRRVFELCPLCDRAKRLHRWQPQVDVAVMASDVELGVSGV